MSVTADVLRVTEAAVVSGVGVREVNRAYDEGILKAMVGAATDRLLSVGACTAVAFYFGAAKRLTAEERLFAIGRVAARLRAMTADDLRDSDARDWTVRDDFLTIDMAPFVKATAAGLDRLAAARQAVEASADVLGGMPVLKGTRVPVYDVAASVAAGQTQMALLAAFPMLSSEQINLATVYADAYPSRGRPRLSPLPSQARLISERRVPRRRHGE
ncbi:MAG: DUF433 domain-containing protein [Proteobacteria bacterium]|nr:DUF433 domain-containing protein [Pseudomonadota bacterium]